MAETHDRDTHQAEPHTVFSPGSLLGIQSDATNIVFHTPRLEYAKQL